MCPCVFRCVRLPSIAQGLWTPRCRLRSHIYSLTFLTLWHVPRYQRLTTFMVHTVWCSGDVGENYILCEHLFLILRNRLSLPGSLRGKPSPRLQGETEIASLLHHRFHCLCRVLLRHSKLPSSVGASQGARLLHLLLQAFLSCRGSNFNFKMEVCQSSFFCEQAGVEPAPPREKH